MDMNDIDIALHEIKQMVLVAIVAAENLTAVDDTEPRHFRLSETDTDLLSFSIFDIQRRVAELRDGINEPAKPVAKIVLIGGNECA